MASVPYYLRFSCAPRSGFTFSDYRPRSPSSAGLCPSTAPLKERLEGGGARDWGVSVGPNARCDSRSVTCVDAALTVVYLAEIRGECQLALQAEKDLITAATDRLILLVDDEGNLTDEEIARIEKRNADFLRAHINVQAMLTHAAAVSRLLRPGTGRWREEREERARTMRELTEVSSDDLAVLSRGLRNDLEHFDERLYAWSGLPSTDLYQFSPSRGLRYAMNPYDNDRRELSRSYHPGAHLYTFWEETYDLGEISSAVTRVYEAAGRAMFKILDENPPLFAQQEE